MKKLIIEIVLLFALAYILVGCGKTSPQPQADEAVSASSSGDPARDRMLRQLQEIEAAKKKPQQQNQDELARLHTAQQRYRQTGILPDPTQVKIVK